MAFFAFANERVFHDLRSACLLPRPTHARHQLQSIFAALQSSLSSYLLNCLSALSFDTDPAGIPDPAFLPAQTDTIALLMDWLYFTQHANHPSLASWWIDVPHDLCTYAINRLTDIFHLDDPPPLPSNTALPTLQGPTAFSAFSLIALRDRLLRCHPPAFTLAHTFSTSVAGWTDLSRHTLLTEWFDEDDELPIPVSVDVGPTTYTVWARELILVALHASDPLTELHDAPPAESNFSPPEVRWPYWDRGIPEFHASTLPQRVAAWRAILGPFLGVAARTIL